MPCRYLLFLVLIALSAQAQEPRTAFVIDSIQRVLVRLEKQPVSFQQETQVMTALNDLAWQLIYAGQFDDGLRHARKALQLAEKHRAYEPIAQAQLSIGYAIQKKELYFEAATYFEEAKKNAQIAHNDSLLAIGCHSAGMCYSDQGLYRKSIENFRQELSINQRLNLKHRFTQCYNSLGLDYLMIRKPDSALYCFRECSKAAAQTNDHFLMAAAYKNIGRVLIDKGQDQAGVASLKKSITYFLSCREAGQRSAVNYAYTILTQLYHRKKQFQASNHYGTLAWDLANRLNYSDQKVDIAQVLYQNYKILGDKDQAIFYLEKYAEASLKINQDLLNQQHLVAEARFNDEHQKNQIIRLNQEKTIEATKQNWLTISLLIALLMITAIGLLYQTVKRQKRQIEGVNATLEEKVHERTAELQSALEEVKEALLTGQKLERRRVAADLHDNLGGMLSAIRLTIEALDNSQFTSHERAVYDNVLNMTQEAYNEVRLLAHNLQPAELEKYGLTEALRRLVTQLNQNQSIRFGLVMEQVEWLPKELEFTLYSICLELANNMVKHSGASEASFEFVVRNGQLRLLASDNGKGFIPNNTSDGMGMRTIQERTEQMGGTLKIHSHPGEGTLFQFSLPLNRPAHASGQT